MHLIIPQPQYPGDEKVRRQPRPPELRLDKCLVQAMRAPVSGNVCCSWAKESIAQTDMPVKKAAAPVVPFVTYER